jgi:hypothetical protein
MKTALKTTPMKKNLLGLFLTVCAGTVSAQENIYFENNPIWNETTIMYDGCVHKREFNYVIGGDSVVNNTTYKKLYSMHGLYTRSNPFPAPGGCTAEPSAFGGLEALVRSADSNIYILPLTFPQEPEALLYNFNLEVGDTLPPTWNYNRYGLQDTMIVTGITYLSTPNGNMRRFALDWITHPGETTELIEGIGFFGTLGGLLEPIAESFEFNSTINCFGFGNDGLLPGVSTGCMRTNSLDDAEALIHVEAMPNPASVEVKFTGAPLSGQTKVRLTDIQGRTVAEKSFTSGECTLEIAAFMPGIYVYHILADKGATATGKILVQH